LQPGDYLLLRRCSPPRGREYGSIIALRDPRPVGDGRLLLKRVVGLPGESLRIGGGPVQINGRVLIEPYAHGSGPYDQHRGINRLAPDEYFVLGDHRGASTDSRDFGPVRREGIEGVAVFRYWPPERLGRLRARVRVLTGVDAGPGSEGTGEPPAGVRAEADSEDFAPS
jgi:signal peptidase I